MYLFALCASSAQRKWIDEMKKRKKQIVSSEYWFGWNMNTKSKYRTCLLHLKVEEKCIFNWFSISSIKTVRHNQNIKLNKISWIKHQMKIKVYWCSWYLISICLAFDFSLTSIYFYYYLCKSSHYFYEKLKNIYS